MAYGNLVKMMVENNRPYKEEKARRLKTQNRRQGLISHI